jgi:hypothetical protein
VVIVNGLPLGFIELKNAADEDATTWRSGNSLAAALQRGVGGQVLAGIKGSAGTKGFENLRRVLLQWAFGQRKITTTSSPGAHSETTIF